MPAPWLRRFLSTALSTGAGHGSYAAAIVLYPLSMVILILFAGFVGFDAFATNIIQSISLAVVVGLAILQYPFYGFVLSYGRLKHSWSARLATGLIYLHLLELLCIW